MFSNLSDLEYLVLPSLKTLQAQGGSYNIKDCPSLKSLDLPALPDLYGENIYSLDALQTINLPRLETVSGGLSELKSLRSLSLPSLQHINSMGCISRCPLLEVLSMPELRYISSYFGGMFSGLSSLTDLSPMPKLQSIQNVQLFVGTPVKSLVIPASLGVGHMYLLPVFLLE